MFSYSGGGGHHSSSSSGWGWLGAGASLLGALGQGFSWAGAGEAAEVGIFVLAAGYSSCNATTTPPPPPPPTAKTGLRQNPGTRPTGQPKGSQSPHQNGTKTPATGPSDMLPVTLPGAAPQVTDPTTPQHANNGTVLDNSDGCTGGLLGFECTGGGNLIDPDTGAAYCNPAAGWTARRTAQAIISPAVMPPRTTRRTTCRCETWPRERWKASG